ncbi:MAG: TadE/TadG family type IV pilus assembly protein [Acidimicrobiales bacterium]
MIPGSTTVRARADRRRPPRVRGRGAAGQASVELVLVLPVVVLALLLVVQVGLVVRAQVLVVHAAREGARAAAVEAGSPAAARRAALDVPGLVPGRERVAVRTFGTDLRRVAVEVAYRVPTDVALVGPLVGEPTLRARVVMLIEEPAPAPSGASAPP